MTRSTANASGTGAKGAGKKGTFVPDADFFGKEGICGLDVTTAAGIQFLSKAADGWYRDGAHSPCCFG
jgi:hypothetical protein